MQSHLCYPMLGGSRYPLKVTWEGFGSPTLRKLVKDAEKYAAGGLPFHKGDLAALPEIVKTIAPVRRGNVGWKKAPLSLEELAGQPRRMARVIGRVRGVVAAH